MRPGILGVGNELVDWPQLDLLDHGVMLQLSYAALFNVHICPPGRVVTGWMLPDHWADHHAFCNSSPMRVRSAFASCEQIIVFRMSMAESLFALSMVCRCFDSRKVAHECQRQ